ncbi:MAG: complex I NDUFA9 subunit family protein [Alphaproteobacteria bacterium]|nr:complex I NDUFA9 subunit family protein [Alphaproteobacteria bacterium]
MSVFSKSNLKDQIVTVFGGTGFIGSRVVAALVAEGARVRVATRHPQSVYFLRQYGEVGQVVAVACSYRNEKDIEQAIQGSALIVNCIGVLYDKRKASFSHIHTDLPVWIACAATKYRVARFVHISALAVDRARSEYAISKMSGERGAIQYFPAVTILRPSVVFGAGDQFINKFASMARVLPFLPLFGGGQSKFQPVYVEDVALAVVRCLEIPDSAGRVYELGGAEIVTFKQIYQKIFRFSGQSCCLVSIPWWIARIKAMFLGLLPTPPLTNDQLTSLQTDNVVSAEALTLSDLGITSTAMDEILPSYLGRYSYNR